jgi:hypothetical protein
MTSVDIVPLGLKTTYFGLPLESGGVRLSLIQRREFFNRWRAFMGDVGTTTLPAGEKIVSLADVERFAQLYALEI